MKPRDLKLDIETLSQEITLSSEFIKKILKEKNCIMAVNSKQCKWKTQKSGIQFLTKLPESLAELVEL